jgi:hypothetical protein
MASRWTNNKIFYVLFISILFYKEALFCCLCHKFMKYLFTIAMFFVVYEIKI